MVVRSVESSISNNEIRASFQRADKSVARSMERVFFAVAPSGRTHSSLLHSSLERKDSFIVAGCLLVAFLDFWLFLLLWHFQRDWKVGVSYGGGTSRRTVKVLSSFSFWIDQLSLEEPDCRSGRLAEQQEDGWVLMSSGPWVLDELVCTLSGPLVVGGDIYMDNSVFLALAIRQ